MESRVSVHQGIYQMAKGVATLLHSVSFFSEWSKMEQQCTIQGEKAEFPQSKNSFSSCWDSPSVPSFTHRNGSSGLIEANLPVSQLSSSCLSTISPAPCILKRGSGLLGEACPRKLEWGMLSGPIWGAKFVIETSVLIPDASPVMTTWF